MQVIGGKNRPDALLEPGVDFIFEHAIQQEAGERVIDTFIDFNPGVATRLNGRKYIGENTARELGRLVGMVDGEDARKIQAEFDAYRARVQEVFAELDGVSAQIADVAASAQTATNTINVTPPADREAEIATADARAKSEADTIAETEAARRAAEEANTSG